MTAFEETTHSSDALIRNLEDTKILHWQHQRSNIGLLLAPLLKCCGWTGDIFALTDALPVGKKYITITDLLAVMAALGFSISSQHVNTEAITSTGLLIPDTHDAWMHGIVITEISEFGTSWHDGRTLHREASDISKGTLYQFERIVRNGNTEDLQSQPDDWLTAYQKRFSGIFWHITWMSFSLNFFALAMPIFSMIVYDRVIGTHMLGALPPLVFGVCGAVCVELIIRWFRLRMVTWAGTRSGIMVTNALFERLLFLPPALIENTTVSAQISRIRAFEAVREFIASPLFLTLFEAPFVLVLLFAITLLSGPVSLIPLSAICCYALIIWLARSRWRAQGRLSAHTAAQRQLLLEEICNHSAMIQKSGLCSSMQQRYISYVRKDLEAQKAFTNTSLFIQYLSGFLTISSIVAMTSWNLERIWGGHMTAGALVACMILNWRLMSIIQTCCSALPQLEQIRSAVEQVRQVMNLKPESHADRSMMPGQFSHCEFQLQNVGLRYNRFSEPVFLGLTANIKPGQIVAVCGTDGTGKSSLLKMLLGLYPAAVGTLRLNDIDYRQIDPRLLRRQIAYFSQAQELTPGTIAESLRQIDPLAQDYKLRQALMWADAWESIDGLANKMDSQISTLTPALKEDLISRIQLARIYLSTRPVIICDELPIKLLNSATGQRFMQFITDNRGKKTIILSTQREELAKMADQVIYLRENMRPFVGKPLTKEQEAS